MGANGHNKVVLVITDGIGDGIDDDNNAFSRASTPAYDELFETTPHALIKTSGNAVGLPEG